MAVGAIAAGGRALYQGASAAASNPQVRNALGTMAQKALAYLDQVNPGAASAARSELVTGAGGKSLDSLLASRESSVQSGALATMFNAGVSPRQLAEAPGLSRRDRSSIMRIAAAMGVKTDEAVARQQARAASTGDSVTDRRLRDREVEDAMAAGGWTSEEYKLLLRAFNTHTANDVDEMNSGRVIARQRPL